MSEEQREQRDQPAAVTLPRTDGPPTNDVPTVNDPRAARRASAATVRAGLKRRREAREKLSGEKPAQPKFTDGDSDTIAKLRAEKDTIVGVLRELVEAGEEVTEEVKLADDYSRWEQAQKDAKELVSLIDGIPPT